MREGATCHLFLFCRGQPVDRVPRVGVARCRCVPRSHERLGGLLVVVVVVLRNVVCRSCAAPVGLVALVLGDLEGGRWDQRRAADVLLDSRLVA